MIKIVTLIQAKEYLRVDFDLDDNLINNLIDMSSIYIDGMVGEGYKSNEKAVKLSELLQLKTIAEMYEQRGTDIENGFNVKSDRITASILDKLSNFQ